MTEPIEIVHDFTGCASKYGVKCDDGRTILQHAFAHQDEVIVPIVWRHMHDEMKNVLGHGILKSEDDGIQMIGYFNDTDEGKRARKLVVHGDIRGLSVWANNVVEHNLLVEKADIREVSLVLSGSNPGAGIEDVMVHDGSMAYENNVPNTIIIHSGEPVVCNDGTCEFDDVISHESTDVEKSETVGDVLATLNKEQMELAAVVLYTAFGGESGEGDEGDENSISMEKVFATYSDKQVTALTSVVSDALGEEDKDISSETISQDGLDGEKQDMTQKIFNDEVAEKNGGAKGLGVLVHDAMVDVKGGNVKYNRLSDIVIQHASTYGINNIESLFPEPKLVDGGAPMIITEDQTWVNFVSSAVRRVPWSRIKSRYADLTEEDARARGYITAEQKLLSVFSVFNRTTLPTTVYTRQQLDRDDVLDVTDFNSIAWVKQIMRIKQLEEMARAILIGDNRIITSPDYINPDNVRPVAFDNEIYTTRLELGVNVADQPIKVVDLIAEGRDEYKGSGSATLFIESKALTKMQLVRDTAGNRIHKTRAELQAALMVSRIVEVPFFTNQVVNVVDTAGEVDGTLVGVLVNLKDYSLGADKGGRSAFFDDFNLSLNQMEFLLESRFSGALLRPKSAVVFIEPHVVA